VALNAEAPEAAVRGGDAASAPEEGRSGAGDAADAGGGGEEKKGEDTGDPRATPPTDANEPANAEAPGCSEKRDPGCGLLSAEGGGPAGTDACSARGAAGGGA